MIFSIEEFRRLTQLIKSNQLNIVCSFDKFISPANHKEIMNKLVEIGHKNNAVPIFFIFLNKKIKFLQKNCPIGLKIVKLESNITEILKKFVFLGAKRIILVVESDRVPEWFRKQLDEIGIESLEIISISNEPDIPAPLVYSG